MLDNAVSSGMINISDFPSPEKQNRIGTLSFSPTVGRLIRSSFRQNVKQAAFQLDLNILTFEEVED